MKQVLSTPPAQTTPGWAVPAIFSPSHYPTSKHQPDTKTREGSGALKLRCQRSPSRWLREPFLTTVPSQSTPSQQLLPHYASVLITCPFAGRQHCARTLANTCQGLPSRIPLTLSGRLLLQPCTVRPGRYFLFWTFPSAATFKSPRGLAGRLTGGSKVRGEDRREGNRGSGAEAVCTGPGFKPHTTLKG